MDDHFKQSTLNRKLTCQVKIRNSRPADLGRALDIWRAAVDATHDFLDPVDRREIEAETAAILPELPLWLAVDSADRALGFMILEDNRMGALFIDPVHRRSGIGRALVQFALTLHSVITTEVNEQNSQAVGFYSHLGFERIGYSSKDQQGRAYPLIYLRKSRDTAQASNIK
jgi:putative acetyltransferase